MVRRAIQLLGGLEHWVTPNVHWVVIKPNLVELAPSGSGVVTDYRVVRAIIKMLYEINSDLRVTIAEGAGGWVPSETLSHDPSIFVGDGFEESNYRQLLTDPEFAGKNLDIVDLNLDNYTEVKVSLPYYAQRTYFIARTILDSDLLINVPVMKIHVTGITVCLKNNIGILPGMVYGWYKAVGYPYPSNTGLVHTRDIWDEEIVDVASLSGVDLNIVDAVVGLERYKSVMGSPKRVNTIIAGENMVAVDTVCSRLMGLNPDDIEHITLAAIKGLGTAEMDSITILGDPLNKVATEFIKNPDRDGIYGQSNRTWLLNGPYKGTDIDYEYLKGESIIHPAPSTDGWSQPIYFFDDYIDIGKYYDYPTSCIVYAFAYFKAPKDQTAELWVGSDEAFKVFVNGEEVYKFDGVRQHSLPNDIIPIDIKKGENTLMVKVLQRMGAFDFALNICEPDDRKEFHGNRVLNLKFYLNSIKGEIVFERPPVQVQTP
jgi:uncharacterized protein (DUF362 family)